MKPALLSTATSFLITAEPEDISAESAPPSGERPSAGEDTLELPDSSKSELRGQAALGATLVGFAVFLMGFLALGWMLSFVGFIAASMVLLDHSRGNYWPARLALSISLLFVVGLLTFALVYG